MNAHCRLVAAPATSASDTDARQVAVGSSFGVGLHPHASSARPMPSHPRQQRVRSA